jgi:hypothetical protein
VASVWLGLEGLEMKMGRWEEFRFAFKLQSILASGGGDPYLQQKETYLIYVIGTWIAWVEIDE